MAKKSPAILATICERIAQGESLRAISADIGIPASTVCEWLSKDAAFAEQYAHAREAQADTLADEIIGIADSEGDPQKLRLMVDARKWVASKLKPKRYGDKVDVEHSGAVTVEVRKCA